MLGNYFRIVQYYFKISENLWQHAYRIVVKQTSGILQLNRVADASIHEFNFIQYRSNFHHVGVFEQYFSFKLHPSFYR